MRRSAHGYRRWIELELGGRLPARLRPRLHDHLRSNDDARDDYDRAVEAFRILGHRDDYAELELDLVERWLLEGADASPMAVRARWWGGLAAVAGIGAVALAIWRDAPQTTRIDPAPVPRGGGSGGLAIDVLCGPSDEPVAASDLRSASQSPCRIDGNLSFVYRGRAAGDGHQRWLSLFGLAGGEVLYYAPTPAADPAIRATTGRWMPASVTVQAAVNHGPGEVVVYGLLSPAPITVNHVDDLSDALRSAPPAVIGDDPWHTRIDSGVIEAVCGAPSACDSAEMAIVLTEESQ